MLDRKHLEKTQAFESKPFSDESVKTTKRKKTKNEANVSSTFLVEIGKIR